MEFQLKTIKNQHTWFHHLVSALPVDQFRAINKELPAIMENARPYDQLNKELMKAYSQSFDENINKYLGFSQ